MCTPLAPYSCQCASLHLSASLCLVQCNWGPIGGSSAAFWLEAGGFVILYALLDHLIVPTLLHITFSPQNVMVILIEDPGVGKFKFKLSVLSFFGGAPDGQRGQGGAQEGQQGTGDVLYRRDLGRDP